MANVKHGRRGNDQRPPEYTAWLRLRARARRGDVAVDARWLGVDGFADFAAAVGPQPFRGAGLARIDDRLPFGPGNLCWTATRPHRVLELDGRAQSVKDWAAEVNLSPDLIRARLSLGWTVEDALTRPRLRDGFLAIAAAILARLEPS